MPGAARSRGAPGIYGEVPGVRPSALHADLALAQGLDTVLDYGRRNHNALVLLQAWVETPTWTDSENFLNEHDSDLRTPEIQALFADADGPIARQHSAILGLTAELPHDQVYEIVTTVDTAAEHAFTAIDQADIPRLRHLPTHSRPAQQ
ncbi:hypothetical protein [Streptomyces sp. NPDC057690]|uniref:hypothetical protein n=1 Tax=Streptomyces sp. NPDC057690 TaxID=3346214 RepID=UPI0036B295E0